MAVPGDTRPRDIESGTVDITESSDRTSPSTADERLSIGDLARATGLSRKALRLYDECELLPPREVDPFSGYHYYGRDQIATAHLIASLRGVGMGLARISVVLGLPAEAAVREIQAWHRQEQANAVTRDDAVATLIDALGHTCEGDPTMTKPVTISTPSRAHIGSVRTAQLDAAAETQLPGGRRLISVADGFASGRAEPDPSFSTRILAALEQELMVQLQEEAVPASVETVLDAAWTAAVDLIDEWNGTTLTAALIDGTRIHILHIGDTRALIHHGTQWEIITNDHTHVQSLVAEGRLSGEEAADHPERATLNRALAEGAPTPPDHVIRTVERDARLLLISDGIHGVLTQARITGITQDAESPADAADGLIQEALDAGGPDNIAVAVADISF